MNDSSLEARFQGAMTEMARKVLQPSGARTYDVINEGVNQFIDEFADCSHGDRAYVLWMDISDLYDDPRGPLSEEWCEEIGRKAAAEWLSVDQTSGNAIDEFFARWRTREPWQASSGEK